MALPLSPGLTPSEIAFLCEMETVTVIPRQRLNSLQLLGGATPNLRPPHRANLPLWLALLLKRQRRADIAPPPWLHAASLSAILEHETGLGSGGAFSDAPPLPHAAQPTPPFQDSNSSTASADHLPYHWLELSQMLLAVAPDDIPESEAVRRLLRDLAEVRAAKVRAGLDVLDAGAGIRMNGVGAMEVGEARGFVTGVVDGLRKVGKAREEVAREEGEERRRQGGGMGEDDEDML